jgi:hypothetical protein
MTGRWMGKNARSQSLVDLEQQFRKRFQPSYGANVTGLALGIAGDSAANVLWRLLHGELDDGLEPHVWWISLGNNDLGRMQCSEEVVVIGILRVVEEIMTKRPNARIVINSVFPMTELRGGAYPVISDYKDSFIRSGKHPDGAAVPNMSPEQNRRSVYESNEAPPADAEAALAQAAEAEEEARDAIANHHHNKVERVFERQYRTSTVLNDAEHARKNRLGTFRAAKKPLWASIKAINQQLKKFAANNADRGVSYYDATKLFVSVEATSTPGVTRSRLRTELISPRGHPTALGFAEWEDSALQFLNPILADMKPHLYDDRDQRYYGGDDDTAIDTHIDDYFERESDDGVDDHIADGAPFDSVTPPQAKRNYDESPPGGASFTGVPPPPETTTTTTIMAPVGLGGGDVSEYTGSGGGAGFSKETTGLPIAPNEESPMHLSPVIAGTGAGYVSDSSSTASSHNDLSLASSGTTSMTDMSLLPDLSAGAAGDNAALFNSPRSSDNVPPDGGDSAGSSTRPLGVFTVVDSAPASVVTEVTKRDEDPGEDTEEETRRDDADEEEDSGEDSEVETRRDDADEEEP